jgi:hypothetical protein
VNECKKKERWVDGIIADRGLLERFYLELIYCGASVPADLGRTRRCAAQNTSSILALLAPRAPELGSASCASRQSTQEKTALGNPVENV